QTVTVSQASSSTSLTIAPNPSAFSQLVTLKATVTPVSPSTATPTGQVQFFNGTTSLGTATLDANGVATLTTSALPLGSSSIPAKFLGSASFATSTSAPVTATVRQSNSAVTLTISKEHPVAFEAVTLTATVKPGTGGTGSPTGTVLFFSNNKLLGSSTISNGTPTFVTTKLTLGTHILYAGYKGDTNFNPAASPKITALVGDQVERWLNAVYMDAFHRPAQLFELDLWRTQLDIGASRMNVVTRLVTSPEGQVNQVRNYYLKFLR